MQFNEIERNLNSQNLNSNLQRDRLEKYKEKMCSFDFFAFLASKLIEFAGFEVIDPFVCLMQFFDTHNAMIDDILCHMACVIKWHFLGSFLAFGAPMAYFWGWCKVQKMFWGLLL